MSIETLCVDTPHQSRAVPFLRWAGSKRAIVRELACHSPATFNRYIEPFAGSACLFFHTAPRKALLADLNRDLIETYQAVRDDPVEVARKLANLPFGREAYYQIRQSSPPATKSDRAARFIYLNRFCFNALYRTNAKGQFNVPFGAPRNARVPSVEDLVSCSEKLKSAELICSDFFNVVIDNVQKFDFIYLDPPFFQTEGRVFRQYTAKPFMVNDLERLSMCLETIDRRGATFLMSYAQNNDVGSIVDRWFHKEIKIHRNIAGFASARGQATEILISNRKLF